MRAVVVGHGFNDDLHELLCIIVCRVAHPCHLARHYLLVVAEEYKLQAINEDRVQDDGIPFGRVIIERSHLVLLLQCWRESMNESVLP